MSSELEAMIARFSRTMNQEALRKAVYDDDIWHVTRKELMALLAAARPVVKLPQRYRCYTSYKYDNPQHEIEECDTGDWVDYDAVLAALKAAGVTVEGQ